MNSCAVIDDCGGSINQSVVVLGSDFLLIPLSSLFLLFLFFIIGLGFLID